MLTCHDFTIIVHLLFILFYYPPPSLLIPFFEIWVFNMDSQRLFASFPTPLRSQPLFHLVPHSQVCSTRTPCIDKTQKKTQTIRRIDRQIQHEQPTRQNQSQKQLHKK